MTDPVAEVAARIKAAGESGATLRIGLVTAVQESSVQLDITGEAWCSMDRDTPTPAVGDRVYALQQGSVVLVAGRLTGTRGGLPIGSMSMFAGSSTLLEAEWLVCDGRSLVRTDYPALFAAIGTTYGSASATTFSIPDMEDRFAMGDSASTARGQTGGAATVTLTEANMPVHDHSFTGIAHNHTQDPHNHSLATGAANIGSAVSESQQVADNVSGSTGTTTASNNSATAGGTVGNAGSGTAHQNLPPYLVVHYIIRAS